MLSAEELQYPGTRSVIWCAGNGIAGMIPVNFSMHSNCRKSFVRVQILSMPLFCVDIVL
ncbi:hypothetical protein KP509_01G032200 [Ceratopteris richardii]|uniref:Uncharacterized protein n=1 Tax=Ceratopteris richardii TaxID=49495 RepID=A0A8T2VFL9_CERRI|nr:hypothetical protein KP509_01G032200 [Ceratopteris richardii]